MRAKRLISLLSTFALIAALFCCCSLSAAAASGWREFTVYAQSWSGQAYVTDADGSIYTMQFGTVVSGGYEYNIDAFTGQRITFIVSNRATTFDVAAGDKIIPATSSVGGWLGGANNRIYRYRWVFYNAQDTLVAAGAWLNKTCVGNSNYNLPWHNYVIDCNASGTITSFGIQCEMSHPESGIFSMSRPEFQMGYGNYNDYLAQQRDDEVAGALIGDNYNKPDGSLIDDFDNAEAALLDGQSQGLNTASNLFKNFSLLDFSKGLNFWLMCVNTTTDSLPWLSKLLTVSLSLGILLFVLGVGPSVLDRVDDARRVRSVPRPRYSRHPIVKRRATTDKYRKN